MRALTMLAYVVERLVGTSVRMVMFGVGVRVAVFRNDAYMYSSTCMGVAEACFVLRSRLAVMADARALTMLAYAVERLVGSQV